MQYAWERTPYNNLVRKPGRKTQFGELRRRLGNNIRMNPKKIAY
jgi:hypothetical protein